MRQQCKELLLHGVLREKDLESCSGEFARELEPHIAELEEDYGIQRERITFENEAQAAYLQNLDLSGAVATAQKACEQMLQEQQGDRESPGDAGKKRAGIVGIRWLFNPEQPEICGVEHDEVFSRLGHRLNQGEGAEGGPWLPMRDFVTDFLGTRTRYDKDCQSPSVLPSRRLDCEAHDAVERQVGWHQPLPWSFPSLDEEYFEWLDVLKAIAPSHLIPHSQLLVVVEIGAAHGPWAARAWRANQLLDQRPMHLVLVEPHPEYWADAFAHLAMNMVEMANFTIWQAGLGPAAGSASFNTRACSLTTGHAPPIITTPTDPPPPAASAHNHAEAGTHDVVEVQIVTLDSVLAPFDLVHLLGLSPPCTLCCQYASSSALPTVLAHPVAKRLLSSISRKMAVSKGVLAAVLPARHLAAGICRRCHIRAVRWQGKTALNGLSTPCALSPY